jgi:rhomboid protease GluP
MPATWGLIILSAALFLLDKSGRLDLITPLAKYNEEIWNGQVWRFLSAVFVHRSLTHFLINCFALYCFGTILEALAGPKKLLIIYVFSGIIGNLLSVICNPDPSAGASGAIFGLVGGLSLFAWQNRMHLPRKHLFMLLLALIPFLLVNQVFGGSQQGIDSAAHLGGFAGGAFTAWILNVQVGRRPTLLSMPLRLAFFTGFLVILCYCAMQPNPSSWKWHLSQGDRLLREGKAHSALQEYLRARELQPLRKEIHVRLAAVYTELGVLDRACSAWRTILELDPSNSTARYQLDKMMKARE